MRSNPRIHDQRDNDRERDDRATQRLKDSCRTGRGEYPGTGSGTDHEGRRGKPCGNDRGMVTAELAVCLPVLLAVFGLVVSALSVVHARIRVQDAAREAARAAARGDVGAARRLSALAAPGASVRWTNSGGTTEAVATLSVRLAGGWLPAVTVRARAVAITEPTEEQPSEVARSTVSSTAVPP